MRSLFLVAISLVLLGKSLSGPTQRYNADSDEDQSSPDSQPKAQESNQTNATTPASSEQSSTARPSANAPAAAVAGPVSVRLTPTGSRDEVREVTLQGPTQLADYLKSLRRPGLRVTVDSVDEGFKKKNVNDFQDERVKIEDRNSTEFTRNGQVQRFEGPNFKLKTAILRENTNDNSQKNVITDQDSERNSTKNSKKVTQFVGTLDTDQFSAGALLTDNSDRGFSSSVRQTVDGNRETRLQRLSSSNSVRGSFLKAQNVSVNARFQTDTFSNRERQVSDIALGGASDNSASEGFGDESQQ